MKITFRDVAGLEKEILELKSFARSPEKRLLCLIAPPGCGKTLLIEALMNKRRRRFHLTALHCIIHYLSYISDDGKTRGPQLFSKKSRKDYIIIDIDEADTLVNDPSLLDWMIKEWQRTKVKLILLSCEDKILDDFKKRGCEPMVIKWGLPDISARREILKLYNKKLRGIIPDLALDVIANDTDGFSSAQLESLTKKAADDKYKMDSDSISALIEVVRNPPKNYRILLGNFFYGLPGIGMTLFGEKDKTQLEVKTTALVPLSLPEIKITGHGMLALRKWQFYDNWLHGTYKNVIWQEQMVADEPPTKENNNGLYGIEFSPEGLMRHGYTYLNDDDDEHIFGIIQMRGDIQPHTDRILRAEFARIVCLFVPARICVYYDKNIVRALIRNYPNVPVYVLNNKQIAEVLFQTLNERRQ